MNLVAASEYELLSLTRALFDAPSRSPGGSQPSGVVSTLLRKSRKLPDGIGPTARRLMEDTLGKGLILALIRRGGWRRADFMKDGGVSSGRLWERHTPPAFHLSPFAMHLCRWLVSQSLPRGDCEPLQARPVSIGDELLLYLAFDLTERARCADALAAQKGARSSALCWLGFADVLAQHAPNNAPPPDISVYVFARWLSGDGLVVLEALQPDLARRWVAMEHRKRRLGRPGSIIDIGRVQEVVLRSCFSALSQASRPDLAWFAIAATRDLLAEAPTSREWEPALESGGSLRLRSDARRASVVLLDAMAAVRRWVEQARSLRFFDDGYDGAQLLLRLWESLGDRSYERAATIVRETSSIEGLMD